MVLLRKASEAVERASAAPCRGLLHVRGVRAQLLALDGASGKAVAELRECGQIFQQLPASVASEVRSVADGPRIVCATPRRGSTPTPASVTSSTPPWPAPRPSCHRTTRGSAPSSTCCALPDTCGQATRPEAFGMPMPSTRPRRPSTGQ
ncbi:hypothetical protein E1287_33115 [Actinomadura sp. KC06]|uniref:hypothetical protein n=1 Tax=Actinomadura sp. KC06 TaxID=2530369 RepID=UPI001050EEEC|nr:hypothetical protein [Actinomadura sp. KC06]TDD28233.1 hypothetical protein E1287_33115 [Actinomadura sp. KC06]